MVVTYLNRDVILIKSHPSPLRMVLLTTLAAFSIGSAIADKPEFSAAAGAALVVAVPKPLR